MKIKQLKIPFCIFLVVFGIYLAIGIPQHLHFGTNAYDFGIHDQAVWKYAHFQGFENTVMGFSNVLGDHFDPIMMLFAPVFWIWDDAKALLVAQALVVALGIFPAFFIAKRHLKNSFCAGLLSAAYGLSIGIISAIAYPVHDLALVGTFFLFAYDFLEKNKKVGYWTFIILALLCKENVSIMIAAFGLYLFVFRKGFRKTGLATFVLATLYFAAVMKFILPALANHYNHWIYLNWGKDPLDVLKNILLRPIDFVRAFFDNPEKTQTLKYGLGSFAFLFLAAPSLLFVIVPILAERFLSTKDTTWGVWFHYSAPLMSVLFIATVVGIKRIVQISSKFLKAEAVLVLLSFAVLFSGLIMNYHKQGPLVQLVNLKWDKMGEREKQLNEIIKSIPADVSVSAQSDLLPHLSHRNKIYMFPNINNSEYVVLEKNGNTWPLVEKSYFENVEKIKKTYRVCKENDYGVIYAKVR